MAGIAVVIVEKEALIDGQQIQAGDVLLGLPSSGPHSNGDSVIRKILERAGAGPQDTIEGQTLADLIMAPTRIYVRSVLAALKAHPGAIRGMAHITGGGLSENIPRVLPAGLGAQIQSTAWQLPALVQGLQTQGQVADEEMHRAFIRGLGMWVLLSKWPAGE